MKGTSTAHILVGAITTIALVTIAIFARVPTYHAAPFFLIPVVWAMFACRRILNLQPLHYALLASAILLHMLGAFGFYQKWPLPFSFDILVHYYFAVAVTPAVHSAVEKGFGLRGWRLALTTFLFIMGMGALHEIMEYASYLLLGEEQGMLKLTSYRFDTQRDLTNNLLGALTSLIAIRIARYLRRNRPQNSLA